MKRGKAICDAAALAAVALTVGVVSGEARASVFLSSMEKPTEIDTTHPGTSVQQSWTWGDSFDSNIMDHAQSPLHATDGTNTLHVHSPNGGFSWGTQYLINRFNEPSNPNEQQGIAKFDQVTQTTKLLYDFITPAAAGGPSYRSTFAALNFAGGFIDSYNSSSLGHQYGLVAGPNATTVQTYTWDFGSQMIAGAGSLWPNVSHFIILHLANNSPGGTPAEFYFDNVRFVNVNTAVNPTWQAAGAGDWTTASNWANGVPNAQDARAIFYGAGTGAVTLNSNVTLGALVFDAQVTTWEHIDDLTPPPIVNYTVDGPGGINFDVASGGAGEIFVIAGNHEIKVPVSFADDTRIDTSAGFGTDSGAPINPNPTPPPPNLGRTSTVPVTSLDLTGTVTIASGLTLSTSGAGRVGFGGGINGAGATLHVRGGNATIGANSTVGTLTVSPNAKVTISSGGGSNRVLNAAVLNNSGTLDLRDNKLITNAPAGTATAGVYNGVQGQVQSANNGGAWDGKGITTSMPDAASGLTSIGVATGARVRGLGPTDTGLFAGQTINGNSTIAMYTYGGDANLDGFVSGDDYTAIDFNIATPGANGWANGDFNYDGIISGDDYTVIDFNIVAQGTPFPTGSSIESVIAVPEPAACGFAILAASAMARRRRRNCPCPAARD